MVEAYCMKCKKKCKMAEPEEIVGGNGRVRMQGKCTKCNTKMSAFVAKSK